MSHATECKMWKSKQKVKTQRSLTFLEFEFNIISTLYIAYLHILKYVMYTHTHAHVTHNVHTHALLYTCHMHKQTNNFTH